MQSLEQVMAVALFGKPLNIQNDSEYGFECAGYYFRETDEPVIIIPTVRRPKERTIGSKKWIAEAFIQSGGSYMEPPDVDVVEVAKADSLLQLLEAVAKIEATQKISDIAQSVIENWFEEKYSEEIPF